jgi:hypothetical protein
MSGQPEKKFRAGAITATVWRNHTEKDGQTVTYPTVTFERSYKDQQDQWQTTSTLRVGDLPKAELVLRKAYEYLSLEAEA